MPWGKTPEKSEGIQCSLIQSVEVRITPIPRRKIELLMAAYPSLEWLAYLVGVIKADQHRQIIYVDELSVPPHAIQTSVSAEAVPFNTPANCVGIIHSHHHMGAFHSGTDAAFVDGTYPVSIVVAFSQSKEQGTILSFNAIAPGKTPCGKPIQRTANLVYTQPKPLFSDEEFIKAAKANIEHRYHPVPGTYEHLTAQPQLVLDADQLAKVEKPGAAKAEAEVRKGTASARIADKVLGSKKSKKAKKASST